MRARGPVTAFVRPRRPTKRATAPGAVGLSRRAPTIRWSTVLLAAANVLCAAVYLVLTEVAAARMQPFTIAAGQRLVAGALLLVAFGAARMSTHRAAPAPAPRERVALLLLSLTNVPLMACLVAGFAYSSAINAALIARLDLPLALLLGHLLLREDATRLDGLLIAALLPGVLLVLGVWPNPVRVHLAGDLLFLVATMLTVVNAVVIRRWLSGVRPWVIARWNLGLSGVWLLLLQLLFHGPAAWRGVWEDPACLGFILAIGLLAVCEVVTYYGLLRRLLLWHVRCVLLLIPVATMLVAHLRQGATLKPPQWLGAIIMIGCLLIMLRNRMRKPSPRSGAPMRAGFG